MDPRTDATPYPSTLLVLHEHINQILFLRRPSVAWQSGHEVPAEETLQTPPTGLTPPYTSFKQNPSSKHGAGSRSWKLSAWLL